MFWRSSKKKINELEEKTYKGFESVKKDMDAVGKWIKHLDSNNKQLFDLVFSLKRDLSSISDELGALREGFDFMSVEVKKGIVFTVYMRREGRVTVPKELRDAYNLEEGDLVECQIRKIK